MIVMLKHPQSTLRLRRFECRNGFPQVTVADFPMYELLDQHRLMIPGVLDPYPKLKAFMDAFEALPKIKAYMASAKFMKRPINGKQAFFK